VFGREFQVDTGSAAAYWRGIELMVRGDGSAALATFDQMRAEEVPADLAYAPYRLESVLRPDARSMYAQVLLDGIQRGELSGLAAARVLSQEGRLSESIRAYAETNPSAWTSHDLECLRGIAQDGALKADLDRVLWRALSLPDLDPSVEPGLVSLVRGGTFEALEGRFRRRLEESPEVQTAALASLDRMHEARSLFIERRYETLLDRYGDLVPTRATTEISTVLFLAALKLERRQEVYRWGQELKRRHPDRELAKWVADLTRNVLESP